MERDKLKEYKAYCCKMDQYNSSMPKENRIKIKGYKEFAEEQGEVSNGSETGV